MKQTSMSAEELSKALMSTDLQRKNMAYKALFQNPMVRATVQDWIAYYQPRGVDADEIIQEAMILLDETLLNGGFRAESKVTTFLLGICKNLIRSGARKVSRVVFKSEISDAEMNNPDAMANHIELIEQETLEAKRDELIQQALHTLTDKCQEALQAYYFENKTMAQVAEDRGLANAEQAKKAVHRCREKLRETLVANPDLQNILNQMQ
ncbi:MAG: sigma-70 family RNA polymerase sigma factor [Chitinophagales bacterium]|nr:sigma-70 family RNA polymerase sigma factor [Chitinophagales bacterium]